MNSSGPVSDVEQDLSSATDRLMGEILTLIDAVVSSDRQCENTKDTIRKFFSTYCTNKWQILAPFRKVDQMK